MKDNKHIKSFNEYQEKLGISDVMISKLEKGDKFVDNNSNKDTIFTVKSIECDGNVCGVYDENGWFRLMKNCKKV